MQSPARVRGSGGDRFPLPSRRRGVRGDLDAVVARAQAAGVSRLRCASWQLRTQPKSRGRQLIRAAWPTARFAAGIHPHQAGEFAGKRDRGRDAVRRVARRMHRACAVGEIGLDYHYDFSPRDVQQEIFRAQIELALERGLPVVIHTREARTTRSRSCAKTARVPPRRVSLLHRRRRRWRSRRSTSGFYLSFAGIVTFPKARELRESRARRPLDRLLSETDARILRPFRTAASATSRPMSRASSKPWRSCAVLPRDDMAARGRRNFTASSANCACLQRLSALTLRAKVQYCEAVRSPCPHPFERHSAESPAAADLAQIFEPIRDDLEAVEREFARHIQSQVALIPEIGRYIQKSGGKRVRPAVLLMAARLSGYKGDRAVLYAAVVEFIHTATLVHDDIIDDADLRRGRLAVHSRWGNDITVLLGDYLYIKSMAMALTHDTLDIVRAALRRHAADDRRRAVPAHQERRRRHHRGRALRDHPPQDRVPVRRLRADRRHARQASARSSEKALREYGFNLGIAFQLVDDLLDFTGDAGRARQADRRRPARRQDDAAAHPPAAAAATRPAADRPRRSSQTRSGRPRAVATSSCALLQRAPRRSTTPTTAPSSTPSAPRSRCRAFPPSSERDALLALPDYVLSRATA